MSFTKVKKKIERLYPSIAVSFERSCIVLRGELDEWEDIYTAGTLAVDSDSLGVINDIKLKGFSEDIKLPLERDSSLEGGKPDVLIVGGGIVGSAVARELSKLKLNIWLVEKSGDVAVHTSSRNDGCVHVGIDLHKGMQKLNYCLAGNKMYDELCRDLNVKFERTAQIIIYSKNWERFLLGPMMKIQAKMLGVWGLKSLSKKELGDVEPSPPKWTKGAMYFSSGGVVSPYKMTIALAENAAENGVKFYFNTVVECMELSENGEQIVSVKTNRGTIHPRLVVNCAGVFADTIADMAGDRTFTIHPRKGTNLILDKKKFYYAKASIARSPFSKAPVQYRETNASKTGHTKGGGLVRTIDGNILVGPNAIEQPYREDYTTNIEEIESLLKKHSLVAESLCKSDIITYFAGIRASTYEEDFVVRKGIFTKNIIEAAGIQSPGITAAPAIAIDIRKWTEETLKAEGNGNFNPIRKGIPHLAVMHDEERDILIKQNPNYGEIVCRCEEVSKGEIVDAIKNPLGVCSLDAIKRRVRPGMGRCQGGFCSPLIVKIIAEEKRISPEQVQKGEERSELLFGDTKKPEKKQVKAESVKRLMNENVNGKNTNDKDINGEKANNEDINGKKTNIEDMKIEKSEDCVSEKKNDKTNNGDIKKEVKKFSTKKLEKQVAATQDLHTEKTSESEAKPENGGARK
ncbi:MAG: FAD-dependent oxidoreductase [Clostridia bacterium]|nr:FAD-dependent oxidoreductase [Clostridia bacterium]